MQYCYNEGRNSISQGNAQQKYYQLLLWRGHLFYERGISKREIITIEEREPSTRKGAIHCSTTPTLTNSVEEKSVHLIESISKQHQVMGTFVQCVPCSSSRSRVHSIHIHYHHKIKSVHFVRFLTPFSCRLYSQNSVRLPIKSVLQTRETYTIPNFTQVYTAAKYIVIQAQ